MPSEKLLPFVTSLLQNKVVGYPTETFYGLGCLALESEAIDCLVKVKPRTGDKPYPLILGSVEQSAQVAREIPAIARSWMKLHWPGPLTLVLPAKDGLDSRIVGESGGVAVRVSSHPLARALALAVQQPIISTSANPTGQVPPSTVNMVRTYFPSLLCVDGGDCAGGEPSTIVDVTGEVPRVLREGAIASAFLWASLEGSRPEVD